MRTAKTYRWVHSHFIGFVMLWLISLWIQFSYCQFLIIGTFIHFNGSEVQIENSITRLTVQLHEACRVMPNSYPEWRNFQLAPNDHYGFFFLHTLPLTIAFKLLYVSFYQYDAEISTFSAKKCFLFGCPTCDIDVKTFARKWHHKLTFHQTDSLISRTRVVLHPLCCLHMAKTDFLMTWLKCKPCHNKRDLSIVWLVIPHKWAATRQK